MNFIKVGVFCRMFSFQRCQVTKCKYMQPKISSRGRMNQFISWSQISVSIRITVTMFLCDEELQWEAMSVKNTHISITAVVPSCKQLHVVVRCSRIQYCMQYIWKWNQIEKWKILLVPLSCFSLTPASSWPGSKMQCSLSNSQHFSSKCNRCCGCLENPSENVLWPPRECHC